MLGRRRLGSDVWKVGSRLRLFRIPYEYERQQIGLRTKRSDTGRAGISQSTI